MYPAASTASLRVDTVSECTQLHQQQVCMSILCQNVPNCINSKSACRYCVRMYPAAPAASLLVDSVSVCTHLHQQQVCMSILCQNVPSCINSKSPCRYCVRIYPTASTASLHVDTVSECTQLHQICMSKLCQNVLHQQQVCMSILCQNLPRTAETTAGHSSPALYLPIIMHRSASLAMSAVYLFSF